MSKFEFDVDVSTYDLLRRGVLVADRRRITVIAEDYLDASRLALELAACDGAMPTDLWWRY